MTNSWNFLEAWKNRQDSSLEQEELPGDDCDSPPVSFPDNETPVKIVFEASLTDFKEMLSALEKGAILSYPDTWHKVWWNFVRNWECTVSICDEVVACFEDEYAPLMDALSNVLQYNTTVTGAINNLISANGGAQPGTPLTEQAAEQDRLPDNVRNEFGVCDLDSLWGAMIYLVQSGNRAITDFFEVLEVASNTLEASTIVSKAIPAAGDYISAIGEFANFMQETVAEGYAGAYTEDYEDSLACDIFCLARTNCELSLDAVVALINGRLSAPIDIADFGEIMAGIAAGTWIGDEIADVAFLCYFSALRFGQQFGAQIGIRPLTVLMSLGADLLASDNWTVLCDCPDVWNHVFPDANSWDDWTLNTFSGAATTVVSNELVGGLTPDNSAHFVSAQIAVPGVCTSMRVYYEWSTTDPSDGIGISIDGSLATSKSFGALSGTGFLDWYGSATGATFSFLGGVQTAYDSGPTYYCKVTAVRFTGEGSDPF